MADKPALLLLTRPDCQLCEEFREALEQAFPGRFAVREACVDDDPEWPGRKDLTLVGIARTVAICLEVATTLAARGIEAEVVDLLSLYPLDEACLAASVRRTHRLVVVDEDHPHCSIATDIAARLQALVFGELAAPIKLVTGRHVPVPYSTPLESAYVPSTERVEAAVREVLG